MIKKYPVTQFALQDIFVFLHESKSMMEETHMRKGHCNIIFVAGCNDMIITDGAAALGNKGNTALMCPFDIITKREEGI